MPVTVTGQGLTLDEVVRVARANEPVVLAPDALERMTASRAIVERASRSGERIYGLTTGVGARRDADVTPAESSAFNRLLLLNHRVGQGPPLADEVVRAALLKLANNFAAGTAGVRPELAEQLVAALNDGARPSVRRYGSVGIADLALNADLAVELGLDPTTKEGLSLVNHNAFSTGAAALAVADAATLLDALDLALALDMEAFAANVSVLHPAVGETRPYPGLVATLERVRALLDGSYLWDGRAARFIQDPLSFRSAPQVHGAARDALAFTIRQLEIELNASQENPLLVAAEERLVSVGNFEVLPLAAALDFLRIAIAPALTSAVERALKLLQPLYSGLPEGLAARDGLAEDALAEFGVAAQAIVSEARLLAQPVSFELSSTTQARGIEDRMTLAPLGARRLAEQVELGARAVAIELVIAAQAIDLRGLQPLGAGTRPVYAHVREQASFTGEGEALPQDLEPLVQLLRSGGLG
ncbi:MAG TPA: aromatic amino acid ammonia-lyase [Gaiellaceae bacterium]|nr:aromatic amino acid ammonia-lyase [Gaiellaceae bacterium]